MNTSIEINNILSQVEKLEKKDQIMLLQRIKSVLQKEQVNKRIKPSLSKLNGLGSNLWKGVNIDDYVSKEREW